MWCCCEEGAGGFQAVDEKMYGLERPEPVGRRAGDQAPRNRHPLPRLHGRDREKGGRETAGFLCGEGRAQQWETASTRRWLPSHLGRCPSKHQSRRPLGGSRGFGPGHC